MAKITLYQMETCPYCAKVRNKLEELNIDYEKKNVSPWVTDPERKQLAEKSGVSTVPVIQIGDEFLGESADIIARLEKDFAN